MYTSGGSDREYGFVVWLMVRFGVWCSGQVFGVLHLGEGKFSGVGKAKGLGRDLFSLMKGRTDLIYRFWISGGSV